MRAQRVRLAVAAAIALLAAALAGPLGPAPAIAAEPGQFEIESELTCQCGCGLTVHSCNHLNCSSGIPLKKEVAEQIAAGKSREEILSYFEKKYGEKILSAPAARGFNITAWTVPFAAIAMGGLLVGVILVRWRHSSAARAVAEQAAVDPAAPPADPALRARLDRALEDYERRS